MLLGSIEAGGTKFVCGISDDKYEVIERVSFPTRTPDETMRDVFAFFDQYDCAAIGIGSFGPIDINRESKTYGYITNTPKLAWQHFDFVGTLQARYPGIPIGFTTDVNASVLGEYTKGIGKNHKHLLYVTIGTGIGGGVIQNHHLMTGYSALEMGHVFVKAMPDDTFTGCCPYHTHCLEGMACGPSFEARLGIKGQDVPTDHPVWEYIVHYIAQGLYQYTLTLSPEKIILGGGVMATPGILNRVKQAFLTYNNDYAKIPPIDEYIVLPGLDNNAGLVGGFVLANQALQNKVN